MRFVKNPRPVSRRQPPAGRSRARTTRQAEPAPSPRTRPSVGRMPGWSELEKANRRDTARRGGWDGLFRSVPTVRLAIYIVGTAIVATLYVGHVLATQRLAEDAQNLRELNLDLHLRYNRVKGAYDRASGPNVIHDRARRLGLTESLPNGFPVLID